MSPWRRRRAISTAGTGRGANPLAKARSTSAPAGGHEELGFVEAPVVTPTGDFYGGHRPGDNLFGESLVCLDARTGSRVWHFQLVHHGVWDWDPPTAPTLIDI